MKNIIHAIYTAVVCLIALNKTSAQLSIAPNVRLHLIKAGQEVKFLVKNTTTDTVKYVIKYAKGSNFKNLDSGSLVPRNNEVTIPFSTREAGFYRCEVTSGDKVAAPIAVAPLSIQPVENEPSDFDAYWQNQKNELNKIPLNATLSFNSSTDYADIYDFNVDITDGKKAYGYMCFPKNVGTSKIPAIIELPAFGNTPNIINTNAPIAERGGVIYVKMNIHNNLPSESGPQDYIASNITDPNNYYLKYAMQGVMKTIDYLETKRGSIDFNGQVGVLGMSQGGGLAMLAAGIDNRISLLLAMYPALCEHNGAKYGKPSGFPYYYTNLGDLSMRTAQYYDAVYTSKRFAGNAWIALAYNDVVSYPSGVAAAFNQMKGKKILQHEITKEHLFGVDEFFDSNLPTSIYSYIRQCFPAAKPSWPYNPNTLAYDIDAGNDVNNNTTGKVNLLGKIKLNGNINTAFPVFWEKVSGPDEVVFSDSTSRTTTVNFKKSGTYRLRFVVQDTTLLARDSKFFQIVDEIIINTKVPILPLVHEDIQNRVSLDSSNLNQSAIPASRINGKAKDIRIYPNPTQNELYITNIEASDRIEVCDLIGKIWLSKTNQGTLHPLSIAHLPNGVYIVSIKNQANVFNQRVVKQ
jgi:cephalosporin-C deacetylase